MGMADDILLNKYKNKSMANDILSGNYTRRQNIRTVNDVANRFWNANNQVVGTFKNIGREKQAKSKAEFEALLESQAGEPLGITKDNQMFKAGAFSNGYQPWDITKSILGTTTDAFGQVGLGILSPVEGKVDWLQNRFADMQDLIGDKEGAEKTRRKSEEQWGIVKELQENTDYFNKWSFLNNGGKQVFQGLGTSLLAMGEAGMGMALGGTEAAGSVVSLTNMGLGSAGSNENEARMKGASNAEAAIYGAISGTGEALSEMMFGGISRLSNTAGIGKGIFDSFDKEVADHFASKVNSKLAKTLIQYGISAASEGVEEIASGVVDVAAKKLTYMSDEQLSKLLADEKLMDAFVSSAISAGISQLPGVASNISNQKNGIYRDYLTNLSDNESKIIDAVVEERAKGQEITNKQKAEISDQVKKELFEGKLTTSEIDKALGDTTIYANPSDIYLNRIAVNERTNFTPIQSELEIDKSRINKNSSLEDIQNKVKLLQQDFLNQNNNIKNTTAAHELFNEMKSVIQATGEQVRLTSYNQLEQEGKVKLLTNKKGEAIRDKSGRKQYTDNKGNLIGINGFRDGQSGEIVLNSDSRAMFETTMGHEIGESLKANSPDSYKLLRELAVEVGRNDGTLTKETFDALKRAYGELGERTDSYLDEYVNDKIGELFDTNSNLINEISKKPSLLRSFINEIKYLVKKFTTSSPEGKKLLEAQHNLEKMLKKSISELNVNQSNNTQEGTKYSVRNIGKFNETVYNNIKKAQLPLQEYKRIESIIDSDTSIKQGRNILENIFDNETNMYKDYKFYYKEIGDWKIYEVKPSSIEGVDYYERFRNDRTSVQDGDGNVQSRGGETSSELYNEVNENGKPTTKTNELSGEYTQQGDNAGRIYREGRGNRSELNDTRFSNDIKYSLTDVTNEKTGYENVPDRLLGFSSSIANQKGYNETKYPYILDLQISVDGGKTYFEDSIKGLNRKQAIERAKRNWGEDAILKEVPKTKYSLTDNQKKNLNQFTEDGILMSYVRNPNSNANQYKNLGQDFGQGLEPSGEYMNMDTFEGRNKIDGLEYGTIRFNNPLIIDNEDTTSKGWKKELSDKYNGLTGKELSNAVMQDGYDAVMSRDNNGNIVEVVNLNGNKLNNQTRYSLSDNQGRELTPEQQEYFKDSKVRDDEGRLLEVYHGTTADFNTFDRGGGEHGEGYYFTEDYDYADEWSGGEDSDNRIVTAYLNLSNPLSSDVDLQSESMKKFIDGISAKWGLSEEDIKSCFEGSDAWEWSASLGAKVAESMGYGQEDVESIVGFEIDDPDDLGITDYNAYLGSYAWENGLNQLARDSGFDGIIAPIYNSESEGLEYIAFNSNQIKNVDNTNPTSNPDIRYSLSPQGEMVDNSTGEKVTLETSDTGTTGTLMAIHNLNEDKLKGVIELGGFPVPSIAVTNPNLVNHNQFGDISVLFGKDTINPEIEANEVYDRDIWSPTIRDNVQIDYELNDDAIETAADNLGIEKWRLRDAVEDNSKPEYLIERLLREEKLIDKYITDNNIPFETAYKDAETSVDIHQSAENLRKFIRDNDLTVEKLVKDKNLKQKYYDEIKKYYDESSFPQAVKENLYKEKIDYLNNWIDSQHGMDINSVDDIPRGLRKYQRDFDLIKSGDNKVIDEWQTEKNKKQAAIDNGIEDYLKEQTKDVYGEKGIRNDVELFTNSGNRRKFWALHDEYNLDNLVEALTRGETTGTQHFGSGYGQIQATMANRFNSISDIKANEGLLTNLSENNEALENAKANIDSDIEEIESNNDVYYDTVAELLVDFARGDLTVDNFRKLTRNDYQTIRNVSDSLIEKIIDDMNSLKNLPTDYFEAKPQRAVGLDEIQQVIIPSDLDAEFKQQLQDLGIQYTEYDRNIEGDRQRVINQFDDLKFSLSRQNDIAPTNRNGIYTEQIKPQDIQEAIAPIKEQVQELQDTLDDIRYNIAPTVESEPTLNNPNIAPTGDAMELIDQQNSRNTFEKKTPKISSKKGGFKKAWDTVMSTVFNRNVLEDRLARKSGNQQIKYKADIRNNYMAEALTNITDHQTDINFNSIGQGVDSIFGELKALKIPPAVANEFLIDYSNIDRWRAGKGSQTPYEESAKRLRDYAIKYPQLKKWAKKVWQYGANSLQNRVDAGLISQQDADYMRKIYPHYVPYVNDVDNIDRIYQQTNDLSPQELKRARGGATKLLPVYEALTKYTMAEKNAIRTNDLFREIIKTYGQTEGIGFDERSHDTDLSQALISDASGNYLTAYEDGKQISTRIESDLFKELSKESERRIKEFEDNLSFITKPLQKANEFNRNIHTTWSLTFPGKNAFKDLGNALFNSKHTLRMAANYFPGMYELIRNNTDTVKQFKNAYGSGLTMGEFGNDTMNQKTKNIKFLNWVKSINEFIELAPRYAEFKASLQSGDSLQEAIYNAREVTMNFSRGGTIVKALNRNGATFLNSSVQGFDKIIRNFSGENGAKGVVSSLMKVALLGIAPAVFNDLAFGGGTDDEDEDYKALPNYDKDNYYLIKRDDGSFLRIPKSQLFAVLGSAARRTLEASRGEENAFEGFLSNAKSQIGMNNPVENNVFSPIIQLRKGDKMANGKTTGKTWYDDDIVPKRLQDKDANEQYDEKTDRFSVWLANTELGKKLNISPKKLNYLIDQYSGGVGDVVLPWITPEASSDAESLLDYAKATVKDQFVINSTDDNKYVSNFYSKNDELKNKADKDNATDEDKLRYKYTSHISSEMADLYKEKREVQNDSSLSKKEKYEKASEIKRRINEFAKVGLDGNSNIVLEDNYAVVNGDMGYYKDKNGDWKPVAQSDIQATEGNGLTDKETSNYYATKNNISEVNSKYKGSKDYAGKKKDIVNEILKANIPDSAKIELYRDSYNDKMADKYVDAGISADSYLQFKAQTFEADKDKNGKSIINSKKQKVFDYVESMNIPFAQKVMLVKTEYPSYNEYNREVVNYLNNNPDVDFQTMKDILEDLGFEVNGDTISW